MIIFLLRRVLSQSIARSSSPLSVTARNSFSWHLPHGYAMNNSKSAESRNVRGLAFTGPMVPSRHKNRPGRPSAGTNCVPMIRQPSKPR